MIYILKVKDKGKSRTVMWDGDYVLMPASNNPEEKAKAWGCDIAGCIELDKLLEACEQPKVYDRPGLTLEDDETKPEG